MDSAEEPPDTVSYLDSPGGHSWFAWQPFALGALALVCNQEPTIDATQVPTPEVLATLLPASLPAHARVILHNAAIARISGHSPPSQPSTLNPQPAPRSLRVACVEPQGSLRVASG